MLSVTLPGHVLEAEDADERPVWLEHGTTYVYVKYNNLYLMAVTQRNSNAAMILLFLYRLVEVLKVCARTPRPSPPHPCRANNATRATWTARRRWALPHRRPEAP